MRTIEQKRQAVQDRINIAAQRVNDALAENKPAYIVRSYRNSLAVAHSDAAMLEALITLERV